MSDPRILTEPEHDEGCGQPDCFDDKPCASCMGELADAAELMVEDR